MRLHEKRLELQPSCNDHRKWAACSASVWQGNVSKLMITRLALLLAMSGVIFVLFGVQAGATSPIVVEGNPGQNVTLHRSINFRGTVYVRMLERSSGRPATATFWSVRTFTNKKRGTHTGNASFRISGLRDKLRAGHIQTPTIFFVTADGSVWQSISNRDLGSICSLFQLEC